MCYDGLMGKMDREITIYSTMDCAFCVSAKKFFDDNNIGFTDVDVSGDPERIQEIKDLTGQIGVPVIKVGEEIMVGFDKERIRELLDF